MKKLFTTILMMGVAMGSWASYTVTESGHGPNKTITVNYVADGISDINNDLLTGPQKDAKILKLTGDWTNKDLQNAGKIVSLMSPENGAGSERRVYLDLSECKKMACQAKYNGEGETDWTSDNFTFTSFYGDPVETAVQKKNGQWGYYTKYWYYPTAPDESSWTTVDESLVTVDQSDPNKGTALIQPSSGDFSLAGNDFNNTVGKLSGISFPDHKDFTAIPDNLFNGHSADSKEAFKVTFGENVIWIGKNAFKECYVNTMADMDFSNVKVIGESAFDRCDLSGDLELPNAVVIGGRAFAGGGKDSNVRNKFTSFTGSATLKVIGYEAFDNIVAMQSVNLGACENLEKIEYEAFEFCYGLQSITFPASDVLTFIGNDCFKETGLTAVDMSMCEGITEFQSFQNQGTAFKTFQSCTSLETVILPPNLTAIPDDGGQGVFSGCTALKTVTFTGTPVYDGCTLTNPITIGTMAFFQDTDGDGRTNLESVTLSKNVSLIKSNAFQGAKFTELHIPASVGEIEINAFYNCQDLTKLYFDEFDTTYGNCDGAETIIRGGASDAGGQGQGAFEECQHITDIYFNSSAPLHCENNAFDQDITWGAGNADGNFATLHYPKDLIENYVNIKHYLTDADAQDRGKFHLWLHDHYRQAYSEPYKNGWYEFINSGFIELDVIEYSDIILRTFSDLNYAYIVPNGLRAYIVTNVDPVNSEDYQVTLKRIDVIPAKTGVILYGQPNGTNADGNPTLTMTAVQFTEGQGQPYNHTSKIKNYLEPILSTDGSPVTIYPYEPYRTGDPVEVRNFALGRYDNTDYFKLNKNVPTDFDLTSGNYVGFFRMKPEAYKSGYAYLKLYADEFSIADGGEIFVQPDNVYDPANGKIPYNYEIPMTSEGKISDAKDMSAEFDDVVIDEVPHVIPKPATNPKGWWNTKPIPPTPGHAPVPTPHVWNEPSLSWGDRNVAFKKLPAAKFLGEFEEDTDGIVKLIVPGNATANGEFYTLQGVKVTNPTKGVYIQNGKKVIIK